jgi:hypothetical protein
METIKAIQSNIWSCVLRYFDLLRSLYVVVSILVLFSFRDIETTEDVQSVGHFGLLKDVNLTYFLYFFLLQYLVFLDI